MISIATLNHPAPRGFAALAGQPGATVALMRSILSAEVAGIQARKSRQNALLGQGYVCVLADASMCLGRDSDRLRLVPFGTDTDGLLKPGVVMQDERAARLTARSWNDFMPHHEPAGHLRVFPLHVWVALDQRLLALQDIIDALVEG